LFKEITIFIHPLIRPFSDFANFREIANRVERLSALNGIGDKCLQHDTVRFIMNDFISTLECIEMPGFFDERRFLLKVAKKIFVYNSIELRKQTQDCLNKFFRRFGKCFPIIPILRKINFAMMPERRLEVLVQFVKDRKSDWMKCEIGCIECVK
jgi:hypothetical protein